MPLSLLRLINSLRTQADAYGDKALANSDVEPIVLMNGTASLVLYALVIALQEASRKKLIDTPLSTL